MAREAKSVFLCPAGAFVCEFRRGFRSGGGFVRLGDGAGDGFDVPVVR